MEHIQTWINAADLIFWCLFSGVVKCNTFYLSRKQTSLRDFKQKYYMRYVIPATACICFAAWAGDRKEYLVIALIAFVELLMLDQSSCLLAKGSYISSLTGEYVFGRLFLLVSVFILQRTGDIQPEYNSVPVSNTIYSSSCIFCYSQQEET